jgi:hypothetical protein
MRLTVQLVIEPGDGSQVVTEVATLEREALTEATLGLTLAESKTILGGVQETMVAQQAASYNVAQQTCPACGARRWRKGQHQIVLRWLFGTLRLDSPRFRRCACQSVEEPHSSSPLAERLPERTTPERREEGSQVGGTPAVWGHRRRARGGAAAAGESGHALSPYSGGGRAT